MSESFVLGFEHADPKTLTNLLTNLYKDPLSAAVRETISNALDAIRRAGKEPSHKTLSTEIITFKYKDEYSICLQITDAGCGMDSKTLRQRFLSYGNSDKSGEGISIGSFGLGAKSPLAYGTHSFWVTTKTAGNEPESFRVSVDAERGFVANVAKPNAALTEDTGTVVVFPLVSNDDIDKARSIITSVYRTLAVQGVGDFGADEGIVPWLELGEIEIANKPAKLLWNPQNLNRSTGFRWNNYINIKTRFTFNNFKHIIHHNIAITTGGCAYDLFDGCPLYAFDTNAFLVVATDDQLAFTPSREALIENTELIDVIVREVFEFIKKCVDDEVYTNDLFARSHVRYPLLDEAALHAFKKYEIPDYIYDADPLCVSDALTYKDINIALPGVLFAHSVPGGSWRRGTQSNNTKLKAVNACSLSFVNMDLSAQQTAADDAFDAPSYYLADLALKSLWKAKVYIANTLTHRDQRFTNKLYVAGLDGQNIRTCSQMADSLMEAENDTTSFFLLLKDAPDMAMKQKIEALWPVEVHYFSSAELKAAKQAKRATKKTSEEVKRQVYKTMGKASLYSCRNFEHNQGLRCASDSRHFPLQDYTRLGVCFGRFEESEFANFSATIDRKYSDNNADTVSRLLLTRACENIDTIAMLPKSTATKSLAEELRGMGATILWSTGAKVDAIFTDADLADLDIFATLDEAVFTQEAIERARNLINAAAVERLVLSANWLFNTYRSNIVDLFVTNAENFFTDLSFGAIGEEPFSEELIEQMRALTHSQSSLTRGQADVLYRYCTLPDIAACQQVFEVWRRFLSYYCIAIDSSRGDIPVLLERMREIGQALGLDRVMDLVVKRGANLDDLLPLTAPFVKMKA